MFRQTLTLSLLATAALSAAALLTAPVQAAELSLSLGIRQTFPAGDIDGDFDVDGDDTSLVLSNFGQFGLLSSDIDGDGDVDFDDLTIVQSNQGASTSGVIASDGGTTGPLATTGSQTLIADDTWHQLTFTLPLNLFGPPSDWGVLESLRLANTAGGETKYKVWIDDLASTNSSGATVFGDFEAFNPGDEVIFQQPSVASGGDILPAPDLTEVTADMAQSGSQSLVTEFEFLDDSPIREVILSTAGVDNLPNPLIQLREGDYSQVPIDGTVTFTQTTVTFWVRATVVPEPASVVLLLTLLLTRGRVSPRPGLLV